MVDILRRLVQLTRAHLNDLLEPYWGGGRATPWWETYTNTQAGPEAADHATPPPFETRADGGLPYSEALAGCYRVLDLPFGVPLDQVSRQWKTYLKKCHPDRYANDPEKLADATELTQELTRAYETIKAAWKQHRP